MKWKLITLVTAVFAFSSLSLAQSYDAKSTRSGYVLTLTDSIVGRVTVNYEGNNVLVKSGSQYENFQAEQVRKVVTVSAQNGAKVYYSAYFGSNPRKFLFEALVDGEIPLLFREGLKFDTFEEQEYSPYFVLSGESVHNLDGKKSILATFSDSQKVSTFVKERKLKLKSKEDLQQVFAYYNSTSALQPYYAGED